MKNTRLQTFALFLGNILEHYDMALYGFLSPFLAPLFFPEQDSVTQLILTYAMIPAGYLVRPIGSLFFGHFGDNHGRGKALSLSLIGMATTCGLFACIPTFHRVGYFAPLLLLSGRLAQSFFSSGWCGAIPLIDNEEESRKDLMSAYYGSSTIFGILLASAGVAFFSDSWRVLYLIGGSTFFIGLILKSLDDGRIFRGNLPFQNRIKSLWKYRAPLLTLMFAHGFSYATYAVAIVMLNGFVPLITTISASEMMKLNTTLLLLDFAALPLIPLLPHRFPRGKVMIGAALTAAVVGIPLFSLLDGATLATVVFIRVIFVLIGVWFSATFQSWALENTPKAHQYTLISFGKAMGSQLFGAPTAAISLGIYHLTGSVASAGWYWAVLALATTVLMVRQERMKHSFDEVIDSSDGRTAQQIN